MAKAKKARKPKEYASGKLEDPTISKARSLDSLLSQNGMNPFGTSDSDVFEKRLKESNLADLQDLCEKVGIFPSHEKDRLKDQLRGAFRRYTAPHYGYSPQSEAEVIDPSHPDHEKLKKLLRSGM